MKEVSLISIMGLYKTEYKINNTLHATNLHELQIPYLIKRTVSRNGNGKDQNFIIG